MGRRVFAPHACAMVSLVKNLSWNTISTLLIGKPHCDLTLGRMGCFQSFLEVVFKSTLSTMTQLGATTISA